MGQASYTFPATSSHLLPPVHVLLQRQQHTTAARFWYWRIARTEGEERVPPQATLYQLKKGSTVAHKPACCLFGVERSGTYAQSLMHAHEGACPRRWDTLPNTTASSQPSRRHVRAVPTACTPSRIPVCDAACGLGGRTHAAAAREHLAYRTGGGWMGCACVGMSLRRAGCAGKPPSRARNAGACRPRGRLYIIHAYIDHARRTIRNAIACPRRRGLRARDRNAGSGSAKVYVRSPTRRNRHSNECRVFPECRNTCLMLSGEALSREVSCS